MTPERLQQLERAQKVREKAKRKLDRKREAHAPDLREAAIRQSLHKPDPTLEDRVSWAVPATVPQSDAAGFKRFLFHVAQKCPRLLDKVWGGPLYALYIAKTLVACREFDEWEPKGKSANSAFSSLTQHLIAKYRQPPYLWKAFEEQPVLAARLAPFVAHVASGGSVFKGIPGLLPVPLTRKQCHDLLQTTVEVGFLLGVRYQQVKAHGGDWRMARLWRTTDGGGTLGTPTDEIFWDSVLAFFCKAVMLDLSQVKPLIDYIQFRRRENYAFSMKGRTALSLMRDMQEWHDELATNRRNRARQPEKDSNFLPSGYRRMQMDRSKKLPNGRVVEKEIYTVHEILSSQDLRDEGSAMHHCVYSYRRSIEDRRISIWSLCSHLNKGSFRELTIEVDNKSRTVRQARGVCNRAGSSRALRAMHEWAIHNQLTVGTHL